MNSCICFPTVAKKRRRWVGLLVVGSVGALSTLCTSAANAATLYVAKSGVDAGNDCSKKSTPCASITHGVAAMAGGDTLLLGDGTYTESITGMPSGSAGAYTTIRAENDWGVVIDGSAFPDTFVNGINIASKHYVLVRGIHVKMNQANGNNQPVGIPYSDHVKIQRCSGSYGPTFGNAATFGVGPASSYVLIEESYGFGGARYQFLVYQSDHVVVRRSVARNDYWNGSLQCAGFVNYNSSATAWQNDIVLDSDTSHCSGRLYGGFFNENKTDHGTDTSESLQGNIVLNVQAFVAGDVDWLVSGTRTLEDMVIWGSSGGYYGDQGFGDKATITANRMTIGGITGHYDGNNGGAAWGTGFSVYGAVHNTLTNSILAHNESLGVADYTASDYNAFFANGANYGGVHPATAGAHDRSDDVVTASLRYLPRIEPGSPLKAAGSSGGQIGAEILLQIGATGTLHDEAGWDRPTSEPLWPFPNEAQIRTDMASYSGPGAVGARGFATGNSLDGTPRTLTTYVWEYLGNPIPSDVYGFHVAVGSLPFATVAIPYRAPITVSGGAAPYTWSATGSLPKGLSLDASRGVIAGIPTVVGSSDFTINVTDSTSPKRTTSKALTLVVKPTADVDAGVPTDAAESDAASTDAANADAAPSDVGASASDSARGCGCRLHPRSESAPAAMIAALLGLLIVRRRR